VEGFIDQADPSQPAWDIPTSGERASFMVCLLRERPASGRRGPDHEPTGVWLGLLLRSAPWESHCIVGRGPGRAMMDNGGMPWKKSLGS